MSADQNNTDPAATGTTGDGAPETQHADASKGRTFTQEEVSRLVAREVGKVRAQLDPLTREREELSAKVALIEEEKRAAEEAKLSAAQRQELAAKRDREAWEKKVSDLTSLATTERAKRHDLLTRNAATSRVARAAAKLFNSEVAPDLEELVAAALSVKADADGREVVHIRLGTQADTEPLTDETWATFEQSRLARYYRAEGGAGARHGGGAGSGLKDTKNLSASELFELGAQGLKTR